MHVKSVLVALAVPTLISAAAIPQDPPVPDWDENSADIVGGVAAAQGDFPFIVSVQLNGQHQCGGTLLNANTVVSAAHCYFGLRNPSLRIRAGSLNKASGGVLSTVSSFVLHPNYNDANSESDIAILKLSTPVQTSSTISYAKLAASGSDPVAGSVATVAGWGDQTQNGNNSPAALRKVDVPIISRATCRNNYSASAVSDRMFCAGLANGGKDSCQGDSGGPIVDSSKTLIGVVSWGKGCAQPGLPGVYSRIGALSSFVTSNL
ncbi:trypsin-like cysteine/serine peptidase domain-containing protein [Phaeosphaeria sp. MPI-PUGE-AT-0046c]|nr:trypsin-like cysteine/serine peptidase domain-containing protein [Phaeosphaeria sp. MPI-PUGE-AT-0046c]